MEKSLEQIRLVQDWNVMHPVGIDVIVTKDDGVEEKTKTCSAAYLLSASGDNNIQVEFDKGMSGDCDLTRLDVQYRAVILLENGCYALDRVREA